MRGGDGYVGYPAEAGNWGAADNAARAQEDLSLSIHGAAKCIGSGDQGRFPSVDLCGGDPRDPVREQACRWELLVTSGIGGDWGFQG
jgi:hypothetical protein